MAKKFFLSFLIMFFLGILSAFSVNTEGETSINSNQGNSNIIEESCSSGKYKDYYMNTCNVCGYINSTFYQGNDYGIWDFFKNTDRREYFIDTNNLSSYAKINNLNSVNVSYDFQSGPYITDNIVGLTANWIPSNRGVNGVRDTIIFNIENVKWNDAPASLTRNSPIGLVEFNLKTYEATGTPNNFNSSDLLYYHGTEVNNGGLTQLTGNYEYFSGGTKNSGDLDTATEHKECYIMLPAWCGDGIKEVGEACDPADSTTKIGWGIGGCNNQCKPISNYCGNGVLENGEQCEKNQTTDLWTIGVNPGESCDSQCRKTNVPVPYCGNGIKEEGESCDYADSSKTGWGNKGCDNTCNPINSCTEQPNYENAIFTIGTPIEENQARQNTYEDNACYYKCKDGWNGNECNKFETSEIKEDITLTGSLKIDDLIENESGNSSGNIIEIKLPETSTGSIKLSGTGSDELEKSSLNIDTNGGLIISVSSGSLEANDELLKLSSNGNANDEKISQKTENSAGNITTTTETEYTLTGTIFNIGSDTADLTFSGANFSGVLVNLYFGEAFTGSYNLFTKQLDGEWKQHQFNGESTICEINEGYCNFYTDHFSQFALAMKGETKTSTIDNTPKTPSSGGSSASSISGWGGGSTLAQTTTNSTEIKTETTNKVETKFENTENIQISKDKNAITTKLGGLDLSLKEKNLFMKKQILKKAGKEMEDENINLLGLNIDMIVYIKQVNPENLVEIVKIGNTEILRLNLFENNVAGKELEQIIDKFLNGKLTEGNLKKVIYARNKVMLILKQYFGTKKQNLVSELKSALIAMISAIGNK